VPVSLPPHPALPPSYLLIPPSLLLVLSFSFSPIPCFLPIIDLQLIHLFYLAVISPSFILPLFISPFPFSCILLFLLCACRFLSLSLSLSLSFSLSLSLSLSLSREFTDQC